MAVLETEGTPPQKTGAQDKAAADLTGIYVELGRAYAMLQGVSRNEVAVSYSVADAVRERIDQINGTDAVVGDLERLTALESSIDALVDRLKNTRVEDLEQQLRGGYDSGVGGTEGVTQILVTEDEEDTIGNEGY